MSDILGFKTDLVGIHSKDANTVGTQGKLTHWSAGPTDGGKRIRLSGTLDWQIHGTRTHAGLAVSPGAIENGAGKKKVKVRP